MEHFNIFLVRIDLNFGDYKFFFIGSHSELQICPLRIDLNGWYKNQIIYIFGIKFELLLLTQLFIKWR